MRGDGGSPVAAAGRQPIGGGHLTQVTALPAVVWILGL